MQSKATTVPSYLDALPPERAEGFIKLRDTIISNIPVSFEEYMSCGILGYVVPHSHYPDGYHCDPSLPLPFVNLAAQKNFIGFYHMGIYADPEILTWFQTEYPKHCKLRLDMGESCIRFKKTETVPHLLISELLEKVAVNG